MAEYSQLETIPFDTKSLEFDIKNIEGVDIEDLLSPIIQILKNEVHAATIHLEHHTEVDEIVTEMLKLIHSTNLLRMHFEFTLAVFKSSAEEEVQALKEKFTPIRHHYEQVKTKDDFTPVPAKYVVVTFYEKMVLAVISLFERCFKKDHTGQISLVKNEDNLARIKILTHRLLIGDSHYPQVVMFSKEDIFHYPRSHPIWQELHQSATFKEILNKEEATASFKQFHNMNNIGHVIVNKQSESSLYNVKSALSLLRDLLYYSRNHHEAETFALLRLANLKYDNAFQVWNLTEQPLVHQAMSLRHHVVGFDERIFVPRLYPKITKEAILQEYEENTINKIHPLDKSLFKAHDFSSIKGQIIDDLSDESDDKIPVRLLAAEHLTFRDSVPTTVRGLLHKAVKLIDWRDSPVQNDLDGTIVVHMHGGGFVSMSSGSHKMYLNRWVKNLKVAHFSIDYRLAPENKYPSAVDDVWQAYLWIMNYAESVLGIKNKKIIVTGDSAGGNLALALSLRLIRAGLQPPHGCLLMYPALILDTKVSSPSYFSSVDDSLLPTSLLKYAVKAYVGDDFKNLEDPFISPLFASPELLEKLPPIRIVVGSNDPLHDDSWRLLHRMRKLNKDVKLIVHEHIPHGYLCHSDLKNYGAYIEESCDLIRELAGIKNDTM